MATTKQYKDNARRFLNHLIDTLRASPSKTTNTPIKINEITDIIKQVRNSFPNLTDEEALDMLDDTKWWVTPPTHINKQTNNNTNTMANKVKDPQLIQLMQSVKAMSNYNTNSQQQSSSTLSNPIQNNVNTSATSKQQKKTPSKTLTSGVSSGVMSAAQLTPTHSNTQINSTAKVKLATLNYPNAEQKIAKKLIDALVDIAHDNTASEPQARIEINNNTQTETLLIGDFEIQAPLSNAQVFPAVNITPSNKTLVIKSSLSGKTFITITEDEIIIGDVNKEHIRLKQ